MGRLQELVKAHPQLERARKSKRVAGPLDFLARPWG
jgi:hypothetical protein